MRYYAMGRTVRIGMTVLWAVVFGMWCRILFADVHRQPSRAWIWGLLAAVNLSNIWTNYWTVNGDGVFQHSMFTRQRYDPENLRYAGPVRRPRMKRWLRKSIELQVAGFGSVRYASVQERDRFLDALHAVAPQAEVVH